MHASGRRPSRCGRCPGGAGRRRGGKAGTGLPLRLTLGRLTAALELAVAEGKLARNPARYVRPPTHTARVRKTCTAAQVAWSETAHVHA